MASRARKTSRLRFGRLSCAGASYFVTCCTKDREPVLAVPRHAALLVDVLRSMHESRDIELIAGCVMPDHMHLLFTLGSRLGVGQVVGKAKALSRLRAKDDWHWQEESFERQLRLGDSLEDYAFYIFMNPYRAGLCRSDERWPWWISLGSFEFRFLTHLEGGRPVPEEWIGRSREVADRIVVRGWQAGPSTSDGPTHKAGGHKKAHPGGCAGMAG